MVQEIFFFFFRNLGFREMWLSKIHRFRAQLVVVRCNLSALGMWIRMGACMPTRVQSMKERGLCLMSAYWRNKIKQVVFKVPFEQIKQVHYHSKDNFIHGFYLFRFSFLWRLKKPSNSIIPASDLARHRVDADCMMRSISLRRVMMFRSFCKKWKIFVCTAKAIRNHVPMQEVLQRKKTLAPPRTGSFDQE